MPEATNQNASDAQRLSDQGLRLAEAVREACLEAALAAYEDAQIRGLCAEGAWECAVGALRTLDLDAAVNTAIENRQSKIQNR